VPECASRTQDCPCPLDLIFPLSVFARDLSPIRLRSWMLPGQDNALAASGVDGAVGFAIMCLPIALSAARSAAAVDAGWQGFDMHCIKQTEAHYPVWPLYSLGGSGQTTDAANAVTGGEPAAYAPSLSN
jgi:hypothetical protein